MCSLFEFLHDLCMSFHAPRQMMARVQQARIYSSMIDDFYGLNERRSGDEDEDDDFDRYGPFF